MLEKDEPHPKRYESADHEQEQVGAVFSQLDGERYLKESCSQGVNPRKQGEGLGGQHQRNADVNTQEHREATFS
jgi:hypothetical protein